MKLVLKKVFYGDVLNVLWMRISLIYLKVHVPPTVAQLGKGQATKSDEFSSIFNPTIYIVDFGTFKQGFLSMKSKHLKGRFGLVSVT